MRRCSLAACGTRSSTSTLGARSQATLLTLAAIALVLPAAYSALVPAQRVCEGLGFLSVSISVVLLVVYGLFLVFSLRTHAELFAGSHGRSEGEKDRAVVDTARPVLVLAVATAAIAWMSEILVGAIEPTAHEFGLEQGLRGRVRRGHPRQRRRGCHAITAR